MIVAWTRVFILVCTKYWIVSMHTIDTNIAYIEM